MFIVHKNIECGAIMDLRDLLEQADHQVLNEKVSMLDGVLAVLDPFHLLAQSIFIQTKDKYPTFDHAAQ
jgi:hypothetical protein